jgi:hypothetical protein
VFPHNFLPIVPFDNFYALNERLYFIAVLFTVIEPNGKIFGWKIGWEGEAMFWINCQLSSGAYWLWVG